MNNNKQSSVEWYAKESHKIIAEAVRGYIKGHEWHLLELKALEKAKAMHKDEVMDANSIGYRDGIMYANGEDWMYQNSEHYYEETFGGNK